LEELKLELRELDAVVDATSLTEHFAAQLQIGAPIAFIYGAEQDLMNARWSAA
jgi:hypothetical protein